MADTSSSPDAAAAGAFDPRAALAAAAVSADEIAAAGLRTMAGLHRARVARLTRAEAGPLLRAGVRGLETSAEHIPVPERVRLAQAREWLRAASR